MKIHSLHLDKALTDFVRAELPEAFDVTIYRRRMERLYPGCEVIIASSPRVGFLYTRPVTDLELGEAVDRDALLRVEARFACDMLLRGQIEVKYSCPACGLIKVICTVPARGDEDVVAWMDQTVRLLGQDHRGRSPNCHPERLYDIMIPVSGTEKVGGPTLQ